MKATTSVSTTFAATHDRHQVGVLVTLAGDEPVTRPPINVALVLDRSGSMSGEPLAAAREAALRFTTFLTAQDRLSIMYQFMFQPLEGRDKLDLAMTDGRRLAHYQYAVTRGAEVETPLGRMGALHLVRQASSETSGTEIWLSPDRNFLPVKMVIREDNGTRYEQVATRIEVK